MWYQSMLLNVNREYHELLSELGVEHTYEEYIR